MRIIITEKQLKRLIENIESLGDPNPNSIKEYPGAEVSVSAPITDMDGDTENSKPTNTDSVAKKLSPQSPFSHGRSIISRQG